MSKKLASWKVRVAAVADGLGDEADSLASTPQSIKDRITLARNVALTQEQNPVSRVIDWWRGSSIEQSWRQLHLAEEELALHWDDKTLEAKAPELCALARLSFDSDRAKEECDKASNTGMNQESRRRTANRILAAHHAQTDAAHQQVRTLRNLLYVLLVIVAVIDCVLWATGVTGGAIVGLGALGGAVSMVFALQKSSPGGPYNLAPAQTLLKIATGAATALMAVKILDATASAKLSGAAIEAYAVIFGFSQHAFTRLVDQRAETLKKEAAPASTKTRGTSSRS